MNTYAGFVIREGCFGQQDIDVIREVFVHDCYALAALQSDVPNPLVIDIGAHIGTFARKICMYFPRAEVVCAEACPENIPLLEMNTPGRVHPAACYYSEEPLALMNSIFEGGNATGGSVVGTLAQVERGEFDAKEYQSDLRPLSVVTLETVSEGRFIDLLKLDCEGAEINILTHADIAQIGTIVGEYHEEGTWEEFRKERFAGWRYWVLDAAAGLGRFRLENPGRCTVHVGA